MKTILLLLSSVLLMLPVRAEDGPSVIHFKNGSTLSCRIIAVYQRHLVDSEGKGIMLKGIDSVTTNDTSLVRQFHSLDPAVVVSAGSEGWSIDLNRYRPPTEYTRSVRVLTPGSISLLIRYDRYGTFGFQYDGFLLEHDHLIHRVQASVATAASSDIYSNLNLFIGAGYQWHHNGWYSHSTVNFGFYGGNFDEGRVRGVWKAAFLTQQFGYRFLSRFSAHAGMDYFFYREVADIPRDPVVPFVSMTFQLF